MNTVQKPQKRKLSNSISLKLSIVIGLSLLLLIPTIFIRSLIRERQSRRNETILEVTSKWGAAQQLTGPIIIVPFLKPVVTADKGTTYEREIMHILPDNLEVTGELIPEVRHRGIYDVILYKGNFNLNGSFSSATLSNLPVSASYIKWDEARLIMGISDLSGLDAIDYYTWNKEDITAEGGIPYYSSISSGINSKIDVDSEQTNQFSIQFMLDGSELMQFVPSAKATEINLHSSWSDPSFTGSTLPDHDISEDGFTAKWQSMDLKRPFPNVWYNGNYKSEINQSAFGVELLIPVDIYQKTERSVKYALLFIGLTFLVVFFIEIISKQKIHPIQYLLTGAALIVFYSLLLALSEHVSFALAYAISSVSIIALLVSYVSSMFTERRYVVITASILVALYTFLYTVLQLSDLALLIGNIGLFIAIALVMYFSRKIDWYNEASRSNQKE